MDFTTRRIWPAPRRWRGELTGFAGWVMLGMLASLCCSGIAFAGDYGDDEEAASPKPVLPNIYLDMRTVYTTLPAGALSIGFSMPALLKMSDLSSIAILTSPSSIAVDLPLTVDVSGRLSVYGGVSGNASHRYRSPGRLSQPPALPSASRPRSISTTAACCRRLRFNPT
jgi:hypothetical protein